MVGRGQQEFAIEVTLLLLIWHSTALFQQQKQNLTNLKTMYMDISESHVFNIWKEFIFFDLNQQKKYWRNFEDVNTKKTVFTEKCNP